MIDKNEVSLSEYERGQCDEAEAVAVFLLFRHQVAHKKEQAEDCRVIRNLLTQIAQSAHVSPRMQSLIGKTRGMDPDALRQVVDDVADEFIAFEKHMQDLTVGLNGLEMLEKLVGGSNVGT